MLQLFKFLIKNYIIFIIKNVIIFGGFRESLSNYSNYNNRSNEQQYSKNYQEYQNIHKQEIWSDKYFILNIETQELVKYGKLPVSCVIKDSKPVWYKTCIGVSFYYCSLLKKRRILLYKNKKVYLKISKLNFVLKKLIKYPNLVYSPIREKWILSEY